uniref:Uncharacterized protein n=1 Tax=Glossina austeni TaxID=7395 RepID=A0A1A9VD87_GLOAU
MVELNESYNILELLLSSTNKIHVKCFVIMLSALVIGFLFAGLASSSCFCSSSGLCNLHIPSYSVATSSFGLNPSVALVELLHLTSPNPVSAIGHNASKQIVQVSAVAENKNVGSSLRVNYANAVEMLVLIAQKSPRFLLKIVTDKVCSSETLDNNIITFYAMFDDAISLLVPCVIMNSSNDNSVWYITRNGLVSVKCFHSHGPDCILPSMLINYDNILFDSSPIYLTYCQQLMLDGQVAAPILKNSVKLILIPHIEYRGTISQLTYRSITLSMNFLASPRCLTQHCIDRVVKVSGKKEFNIGTHFDDFFCWLLVGADFLYER